jgi:iron complex transport system ATP-binding protein
MAELVSFADVQCVRDGRTILSIPQLSIAEGQHTVILGPNGSGKTTLLKLLAREIYPFGGTGSVRILGKSDWEQRELRTVLGFVPSRIEEPLARTSVRQMVVSGLLGTYGIIWGYRLTDEDWARADAEIARVELTELADRDFETLSNGETKRVMIARAMVSRPRGLVLDEPSTGLDLRASSHLQRALRAAAHRATLILVTHHFEEILPEFDQMLVLDRGHAAWSGPPEQVPNALLSQVFGLELCWPGPGSPAMVSREA